MTCQDQEHKCTLREIKKEKNTPETKSSFEPKEQKKSAKVCTFSPYRKRPKNEQTLLVLQENW